MTAKTIWAAGVAVAAGIGFLAGSATDALDLRPSRRESAPRSESAPLEAASSAGTPRLDGAAPPAAVDVSAAAAENAALRERLRQAESELAVLRSGATRARAATGKGPVFTFGEWGRLDAVLEADWAEMAAASHVVSTSILQMSRHAERGEEIPKELARRLQENVERVRKYEYRTIDKLPTAAQHNGELTHPISVANLAAAELLHGGKPLSPEQTSAIERLGVAFDADFEQMRRAWTAGVVRPRRILEEVRLKSRFVDDVFALLSEEQRAVLVDPSARQVAGLDLYDPTLMVIHTSPVVTGAAPADVAAKLTGLLRQRLQLGEGPPPAALETAVARFLESAGRDMAPVPRAKLKHYTRAEALLAGEATVEMVEGLLRDLDLSSDARTSLKDAPTWYVPRLLAP
jgi:hypothetical protein